MKTCLPKIVNQNLTPEEISYLAGIIDGSSSLSISKQKRSPNKRTKRGYGWRARIILANCDERLILYVRNLLFDPSIEKAAQRHQKKGVTIIYRIILEGPVLDYILPMLKEKCLTKKEQLDLMMQFRKTILNESQRRDGNDDEVDDFRACLSEQIKSLNSGIKVKK